MESNPGCVGGKQVLSPLRHSCTRYHECTSFTHFDPGFDSLARHYEEVEFADSLLCSERFFFGFLNFSPLTFHNCIVQLSVIYGTPLGTHIIFILLPLLLLLLVPRLVLLLVLL